MGGLGAAGVLGACRGGADEPASDDAGAARSDEPLEIVVPTGWDYPVLSSTSLPFAHDVASGDPLADAVILWTRLTIPESSQLPGPAVSVTWTVAGDAKMADVVVSGEAVTSADHDWTVRVEATGLEPATTYWYRFEALGHRSAVGRTRTAPTSGPVSLASVSCASYWSGYFNAYARIADREDLDLVVHCGDHIYDYPDDEEWVRARNDRFDPEDVDFRVWRVEEEIGRRYALYYADPDVASLHRSHPMVIAWDNHDLATGDGGEIGDDAPKAAFWRWTPSRPTAYEIVDGQVVADDVGRGHRHLAFGDVDLMVLDVRSASDDTSILGAAQMTWLQERLVASSDAGHRWRVIVSPVPVGRFEVLGAPVYGGWSDIDGDRDRLLGFLGERGIGDNVFLSGDAHGAFVWDLPREQDALSYDPATGRGSVGVELLANSVTRGGSDETTAGSNYERANGAAARGDRAGFNPLLDAADDASRGIAAALVSSNASMHYANWTDHGYGIVELGDVAAVLESWVVPHLEPSDAEIRDARFTVAIGSDHVVRADEE